MSQTPHSYRPDFTVFMAETEDQVRAAQHLRYQVFVQELGGDGDMVDHHARLERDRFDPFFEHMLLVDRTRPGDLCDQVVGVYRLLTDEGAQRAGQFYSEDEYDLSNLRGSGRKLLELGRSCLHSDYRGGTGMLMLWQALTEFVTAQEIDILFGTASFHGTDVAELAEALSLLHHRHLAPEEIRVKTRQDAYQPMNLMPEDLINRPRAMRAIPALIKGYLRLGGTVGDGAYVDHAFNTTDVCLILDTAQLSEAQSKMYRRPT
jgi:putative hemolysin